jgi:tRNA(fMet)-specific endonuclease VapC
VTTSATATGLVVDTDIVSFFFKGDSRAQLYRESLAGHLLVVSFMTVAELDRWALARNWGARRQAALDQHLRAYVVAPFDRAIC